MKKSTTDRHANTPLVQLSGGEIMRVVLIGAFLSDADLLILDEPTNHLDIASIQALEKMRLQYRSALMVMSHDECFLDNINLDRHPIPTGGTGF